MPLTPTATRIGSYSVQYAWSGTAPFNVWLDGANVLQDSTLTSYRAQTTDGTTNPLPAIEVLDSTDTEIAESRRYSPLVRIQWRGQNDAAFYIIEQNISASWTPLTMVREDGSGYYSFESTAQADGSTAEFRVIPYDSRGYDGIPVYITHSVVCNPSPPAIAYDYDDGTGDLTVEGI